MDNSNKKTIAQWFAECNDASLKAKLQNNLIAEFAEATTDSIGQEITTLNKAISCGFYWSSTPEGFDFWNSLTNFEFAPKA